MNNDIFHILIKLRFNWYICKLGIVIFAWRVNGNCIPSCFLYSWICSTLATPTIWDTSTTFLAASFATEAVPGVSATLATPTIWDTSTTYFYSAAYFATEASPTSATSFAELAIYLLRDALQRAASLNSGSYVSPASAASFAGLEIDLWIAALQWAASPNSGSTGSAADYTPGLPGLAQDFCIWKPPDLSIISGGRYTPHDPHDHFFSWSHRSIMIL